LNLSSNTGSLDWTDFFPAGVFFINGVAYPITFFSGVQSMGFLTGSVPIPLSSAPLITLQAPFVFTAHFSSGSSAGGFVSAGLSGGGIAEMTLRVFDHDQFGNPRYIRQDLTYTFQTPEPTTLLLLGTGLAGITARVLKRKRNRG
jgi:hypothetical protein